ncbi:MAG: DNA recombination protein RmuC [Clostridium sp.]|nr:DNA recombination protein RmuC [Prevotella sp.]MCM1429458.1 DNA recombination protein RmuC [Clostridium sp.]MCM1475507.1 DNA recombination protein RmuC [Muribaculaceae bacterium]
MTVAIIILCIALVIMIAAIICLTVYLNRMRDYSQRIKLELESDTGRQMRDNREELRRSNAEQLESILTPLRLRIEEFTRQTNESRISQATSSRVLGSQLDRLMTLNISIGEEARKLAQALRSNSKIQGDWGETILQQVFENSGLKEGIHYTLQQTRDSAGGVLRDEEGRLRRPDAILHLPGERKIIVDSKVSLRSYLEYVEAETEEERLEAGRRLVKAVKAHVDELADKAYQKIVKDSAEQVLMFIPIEGAYFLAIESDRSLAEYCLGKKIAIVTPTHLMPVVGLISQMWRVESQNRNAAKIARLGGLIYDRMVMFAKDFESINDNIRRAQESYEKSLRDLTSGPQSIISRTQRMKELGAKTTKNLPEDLIKEEGS